MQDNSQENYTLSDLDLSAFSLGHIGDLDLFKPPLRPSVDAPDAAYLYPDSAPPSPSDLPLLTPDNNSDGAHTDSTILVGQNPEYVGGMSPLHMTSSGLEMPSQQGVMADDGPIDEEVPLCPSPQVKVRVRF